MKVAVISAPYWKSPPKAYGGLERVTYDLACGLTELGHKVVLFAPNNSGMPRNGFVVEYGEELGEKGMKMDWRQAEGAVHEKIKHLLQLDEFDIIHGHNWFGWEYMLKQDNPDKRVCHTHHGHCFTPETLVPTHRGVIPIKDVVVGDWVVGHDGQYHRVTRTYVRPYNGDLLLIRTHGQPTIRVTPEHPFYGFKTVIGSCMDRRVCTAACQKKERQFGEARFGKNRSVCNYAYEKYAVSWLPASTLEINDYILSCVPKPQKESKLPISAKLLGYYLSEGYVALGRYGSVRFTLDKDERQMANEIYELLKPYGNPKIQDRTDADAIEVSIISKRLAQTLHDLSGTGAANKRIPLHLLSRTDANDVLTGVFLGDASLKEQVLVLATISPSLAYGVRVLLTWLGIKSHYQIEKGRARQFKNSKTISECQDQYWVSISARYAKQFGFAEIVRTDPEKLTTYVSNDMICHRIKTISHQRYDGLVYNLEVEGVNSYAIMQSTVHNCTWNPRNKPPFVTNLIAISKYMQWENKQLGWDSEYYCYNGIDTDLYTFKKDKGDRLLFVGRFDRFKRPHIALAVAKKLDMPIDLIGGSKFIQDPKYYDDLVAEVAKYPKARILADLPTEAKIPYIQNAKAVIIPSAMREPFGLVAVEAMSCGTPIVVSNDGALKELVTPSTGFVGKMPKINPDGSPADDPEEIEILAKSVKEVERLNPVDCRIHVENNFSRQVMAKNYSLLYKRIVMKE